MKETLYVRRRHMTAGALVTVLAMTVSTGGCFLLVPQDEGEFEAVVTVVESGSNESTHVLQSEGSSGDLLSSLGLDPVPCFLRLRADGEGVSLALRIAAPSEDGVSAPCPFPHRPGTYVLGAGNDVVVGGRFVVIGGSEASWEAEDEPIGPPIAVPSRGTLTIDESPPDGAEGVGLAGRLSIVVPLETGTFEELRVSGTFRTPPAP